MRPDYIIIKEYCKIARLDSGFLLLLEENGLIDVYIEEGEKYFSSGQLTELERYTRMYYDLSINIEGIDAIRHILNRMEKLQEELEYLRSRLRIYE